MEVTLPDTASPPPPQLTGLDGSDGKVVLTFTPGLPDEKTHQFLIVRAGSSEDPGLVIGDPLSAAARQFEDGHVDAGQDYWYRLVAVDQTGNRSDPSRTLVVRVGSPAIPRPKQPAVQLIPDPFPRVAIRFDAPLEGLAVMVQLRAGDSGPWVALAGPIREGTQVLDANPPPAGKIAYRVVYQAANGAQGAPSDAADLSRP